MSASVSIGIAVATPGTSCEQLLRNADLAMYTAKRRGKGRFETYEEEMHARAVERLGSRPSCGRRIARGELVPALPADRRPGDRRDRGRRGAGPLDPPRAGHARTRRVHRLAEDAGLIGDIGQLVVATPCPTCAAGRAAGLVGPDFTVSINLAPQQLLDAPSSTSSSWPSPRTASIRRA